MADSVDFSSIDPSNLTPLFIAQSISCAYPISDLYASSPRYLYYALLVAVFATQWYPWLANVFLGAAATYAGTAAIEALVLISNPSKSLPIETISIPYIAESSLAGNQTLGALRNLVTDENLIKFQPAALELDVDGILAIVVTGYLMMLPIHCWSPVIKAHRVRHLLMGLWNLLMLAGTICALILWIRLFNVSYQYRFCYPSFPDADSVTSDSSQLPTGVWQGNWNTTIWHTFSNFDVAYNLADNCLYPCFNTSQIMRRANSLTASVSGSNASPRTDVWISERRISKLAVLILLIYVAIGLSGIAAVVLLIFTSPRLRRITRVPIHRPKELLWQGRKELGHALWTELKLATRAILRASRHPRRALQQFHDTPSRHVWRRIWQVLRWAIDILALVLLGIAMVLIPATIVVFIVWIEWYIHRDIISSELPSQVGQWTSSVSIALVLVSAVILRLKYRIASRVEIDREMEKLRAKLGRLEALQDQKRDRTRTREIKKEERRRSRGLSMAEAGKMDMELEMQNARTNHEAGETDQETNKPTS